MVQGCERWSLWERGPQEQKKLPVLNSGKGWQYGQSQCSFVRWQLSLSKVSKPLESLKLHPSNFNVLDHQSWSQNAPLLPLGQFDQVNQLEIVSRKFRHFSGLVQRPIPHFLLRPLVNSRPRPLLRSSSSPASFWHHLLAQPLHLCRSPSFPSFRQQAPPQHPLPVFGWVR